MFVVTVLLALFLAFWKRDSPKHGSLEIIHPMAEFRRTRVLLSETFAEADAETQQSVNQLLRTFERKDFQRSAAALLDFANRLRPTFQQARMLNSLYIGLQQEIAAGIERNSADALKAARMLKERPCCVKP